MIDHAFSEGATFSNRYWCAILFYDMFPNIARTVGIGLVDKYDLE